MEDWKFFIYTTFKDFSLVVYDDIDVSHELTPTLTLGLSLGLRLAWGHIEYQKFSIDASFLDFSLHVYDDIDVLHLVSDSQRFSFSQELTPTLTLGLRSGLGLA